MSEVGKPFNCPICLELAYKPVVQGCGHLFCFWCVHRSMNTNTVSHCPVCQKSYVHLPRISEQLHRLLQAVAPEEYRSRALEVSSEERDQNLFSPQFADGGMASSSSGRRGGSPPRSLLQCKVCKKVLYKPVAMNCGHLMCQTCVAPGSCRICGVEHPSAFPQICIDLNQYLEEELGTEYKKRADEVRSGKAASRWQPSPHDDLDAAGMLQSTLHASVGCDGCGMMPILGKRFHCLDCSERCGYDLCQACHARGSSLPGRFNQSHGPSHRMVEQNLRERPWIFTWAW